MTIRMAAHAQASQVREDPDDHAACMVLSLIRNPPRAQRVSCRFGSRFGDARSTGLQAYFIDEHGPLINLGLDWIKAN
jgi:hypothetical protein